MDLACTCNDCHCAHAYAARPGMVSCDRLRQGRAARPVSTARPACDLFVPRLTAAPDVVASTPRYVVRNAEIKSVGVG
jgi:hypothetical protein